MGTEGTRDFWRVIAAYVLPPLGVFLQVGLGPAFWINLLLTFLFYVPGQVHALWIIATTGRDGRPAPDGVSTFVALIFAALLPPVGVALKRGIGVAFLVNVVLTLILWVPGALHAIWVITRDDD